jgi:protein CpxP
MKLRSALHLGLAVATLLGAGLALNAQEPEKGPGMGMGPGFGQHRPPMEQALGPRGEHGRWWNDQAMIDKLKLTDEQRKSMDSILLEHREKLIDMRANVEKAELGMDPLMHDDQPNEGKILAQIDKVAQARADLEKANARFLLAIRGKLTPEQWKQLREVRDDRMNQRQMRHGDDARHTGPGRPGPDHQPGPAGGPHDM